jgi:hypothetical protein
MAHNVASFGTPRIGVISDKAAAQEYMSQGIHIS